MRRHLLGICLGLLVSGPAAAVQDTVVVVERGERLDARSREAREAVSRFNDRSTLRVFGPLTVASNETMEGNVGVYRGPVRVSGRILGDLVVINGDVRLMSTAVIRGDILVVGGTVTGLTRARVDGNVRVYRSTARVERDGRRLELLTITESSRSRRRRPPLDADASVVVTTGELYNRVEGLPLHIGPRIEWRNFWGPQYRIEALAVLRTAGGIDSISDDIGYTAGVEWRVGGRRSVLFGGRIYDLVAPIENWHLYTDEVGLSTFLLHRDYRDYFSRQGVSGYVQIQPTDDFTFGAEIARQEEGSVAARDPWTPFRRDEAWRPNPAIDEGTFTLVSAYAEWDSRPYRGSRGSGWFVRAEYERGMSDDIALVTLPASIRGAGPFGDPYTYDRLTVDVRRYEQIGRTGLLSLRALGTGSLDIEDPLPVQRRLSLGGPGSMPGFGFRRFTCSAGTVDPAQPALCDRAVLFQAEYRGGLSLRPSRGRRGDRRLSHWWQDWDWDDWLWFDGPTIVLFADAGSAWLGSGGPDELEGDVGAGLEFGSTGVYAAKGLRDGEPVRITVRIHRRF